ncbi:DoxX family membrane protein [Candidatus Kaiserbacteria bacterium]|nr:DoxX family membrane protein [Candidatus Kaiserbacteria bacterium]
MLVFSAAVLLLPFFLYAHEVYVLTPEEILHGLVTPPASPTHVMMENFSQFMFWAIVTGIALPTLFLMSLSRRIERVFTPFFARTRKYALHLVRIGVGASLLTFAYAGAVFGPELPLQGVFGAYSSLVMAMLAAAGAAILFNTYSRLGGALLLAVYIGALFGRGAYVFTYIEYAAAGIFFLVGDASAAGGGATWQRIQKKLEKFRPYRFLILRVGFGLSVMFASIYAKVIYGTLALTVVEKYDLTSYWLFSSFSPEFLVLGAAIVEFLCGLLIALGIEVRHTAVFLAFWLTLSLAYFQEMVWPHIILFGLGGAFFLYGYDWYSIEGRFFKYGNREAVL